MLKRNVKKEDSKGMSEVIASLLIILLSIALIIIIWVIVKNLTVEQSEIAETKSEFFDEGIDITALNIEDGLIRLSLQRTGGKMRSHDEIWKTEETSEVLGVDIISVVDLSGSMASCNMVSSSNCCINTLRGSYSSGNCSGVNLSKKNNCTTNCRGIWVDRITPTKEANRELINILYELEDSKIGIVSYNNTVITSAGINLTDNIDDLNRIIDSWSAGGSTCICCGINKALEMLKSQSAEGRQRKIIVMSDGEANVQCPQQPGNNAISDAIRASCDATDDTPGDLLNLTIYSIGAGENVNEYTLREIANCGEGIYFSALNISQLIDAYRSVVKEIKTSYVSASKKFDYIYVVFYNETSSHKEKILNIPANLVIKTYSFNLEGKLEGKLIKIEIYPVILLKSGKEEIGPLFDSWTLQG